MEDYGKITFRSIGESNMINSNVVNQAKKL